MNLFDYLLIITTLIMIYLGFKQGFVPYLTLVLGFSISLTLLLQVTPIITKWMQQQIHLTNLISAILSYLVILGIIYLIVRIIISLIITINDTVDQTLVTRLTGGLLGFIYGFIIILIFVYPNFFNWNNNQNNSRHQTYTKISSLNKDEIDVLFDYLQNNKKTKNSYSTQTKHQNLSSGNSRQTKLKDKFKQIKTQSIIISVSKNFLTKFNQKTPQ